MSIGQIIPYVDWVEINRREDKRILEAINFLTSLSDSDWAGLFKDSKPDLDAEETETSIELAGRMSAASKLYPNYGYVPNYPPPLEGNENKTY